MTKLQKITAINSTLKTDLLQWMVAGCRKLGWEIGDTVMVVVEQTESSAILQFTQIQPEEGGEK